MKYKKLDQNGWAHWILPVIVIACIAAVGIRVLYSSNAAAPSSASYKVSLIKSDYQSNPNLNVADPSIAETNVADQEATGGILPPQNPSENLSPSPNFTDDGSCPYYVYSNTSTCNSDVISATNNALNVLESLPPLSFNVSAYQGLTAPEQIFVILNIERINRGLPPVVALTNQLNGVAQAAANDYSDPIFPSNTSLTGGAQVYSWGSIAAEGTSNPLGSDYYWMYDDGYGGPNTDCTSPPAFPCWGHRDVILGTFTSGCENNPNQYMGTGYTPGSSSSYSTYTSIIVGACGATPTDETFTWQQALQLLNAAVTTPSAPQQVTAVSAAKKGIVLSWQAPSNNGGATVTSYRIYRSTKTKKEKFYKSINCSTTACTFPNTNAHKGTTYYYVIAGVNSAGTGSLSSEVSAVSK